MGANGRTNQNLGVSGIGKCGHGLFIQQGGVWKCVGIFDLGGGKSSNEDDLSIPSSLKDLSWWEFRDIQLLVRVSGVSGSSDHLVVDNSDNGLDTNDI